VRCVLHSPEGNGRVLKDGRRYSFADLPGPADKNQFFREAFYGVLCQISVFQHDGRITNPEFLSIYLP
jgi:hypothetical protein